MARRNKRGFSEYRGRRSGGSAFLKFIIVLLLLVLVVGVLFVLFVDVEYTDDGVRVHFPWSHTTSTPPPSNPPEVSNPIIIVTDEPDPTPEPTPTPEPLPAIHAVEVRVDQVIGSTATQAVLAAGGDALVVTVKDSYGALSWRSGQAQAIAMGVNSYTDNLANAVSVLTQGEEDLYLVARLDCFRDQALATARLGGPLRTPSGKEWYDRIGLRWVSAANADVTNYIAGLCQELAEMGFDEILLAYSGYPNFGETHVLATNDARPEDLTVPVGAFYAKVREALEGTGVRLSVLTTEGVLTGSNTVSGITPELLMEYVDRVWVPAATQSATDYQAILSQAGADDPGSRLVILSSNPVEGSWARMTAPYG